VIRKLLSLSILSIFLTYYASISFFSHTHIVDGVTIVHSHPFQTQQHSGKDVVLLQLLSHFLSPGVAVPLSVGIFLSLLYKITPDPDVQDPLIPSVQRIDSLRAPPFSSFL
jgi:hypothetical protein